MARKRFYYLVLLAMGASWGITPVFMKIAVSTGYKPLGIILWGLVISVVLSGISIRARGKALLGRRAHIPLYIGISLIGAVLPNYASYVGVSHLPAGVMAIITALVPIFAMPIAIFLGHERPSAVRIAGALCGLLAIVLIAAPATSLPAPGLAVYVLIAMLAPLFYGGEGNFMLWYGARGLDSMQILFGAGLVGILLVAPVTLATGQFINPLVPWGPAEWSIVATAVVSWGTYATYLWLVGQAGAVFASQVAYTVTGFGVAWSMLLLGERYTVWVWVAFVLILIGIVLVQPRDSE